MSCINQPNGPFNIKHTSAVCRGKCKFTYNFTKSGVKVTNKGEYIEIKYTDSKTSEAKYTNTSTPTCSSTEEEHDLIVNEIRIYRKSLHLYNDQHADAEMILVMNSTSAGRNLLVSFPITTQNGTLANASQELGTIITYLNSVGHDIDEGGTVGNGFQINLNNFIPSGKGFYAYTAISPWNTSICCIDYIVYDKNDIAISLSNSTMSILNNLINENTIVATTLTDEIKNDSSYAYNSIGATRQDSGDTIWIDCNPTGSDGNVLVDQNKIDLNSNNPFGMYSGINQDKYEKYKHIFIVIAIVIGVCILMLLLKLVLPKIIFGGSSKPTMPSLDQVQI